MVHGSIMLLYCLISITGALVYLRKGSQLHRYELFSLIFFIGCHTLFLIIGMAQFFMSISLGLFVLAIVLVIISRITNGLVLYGKNNWRHYLVTGLIMAVIFMLHVYDM